MITCLGLAPAWDVTYGLDALTPGGIHRPAWKLALPGGKSLNVARALRMLQAPVHVIAPLGGAIGDAMHAALAEAGIPVEVHRTEAATRMCVSAVSDADDLITEFYEQAPPIDDIAWDGLRSAIGGIRSGWLAVSGAVPAGRIDALAAALARAAEHGVRLAVDVHGDALRAVLDAAAPEVVKVNRSEAAEVVGEGDVVELADRLRRRGAAIAVVTDGAAGSVAADDTGAWRAEPFTAGRYTVGAGDSFFAGLLSELDAGALLPDALAYAASVAAANTMRPGAAVFDAADIATGIRVSRLGSGAAGVSGASGAQ